MTPGVGPGKAAEEAYWAEMERCRGVRSAAATAKRKAAREARSVALAGVEARSKEAWAAFKEAVGRWKPPTQ
jgi:hypothetical protein